jgi:hypothetical protein
VDPWHFGSDPDPRSDPDPDPTLFVRFKMPTKIIFQVFLLITVECTFTLFFN